MTDAAAAVAVDKHHLGPPEVPPEVRVAGWTAETVVMAPGSPTVKTLCLVEAEAAVAKVVALGAIAFTAAAVAQKGRGTVAQANTLALEDRQILALMGKLPVVAVRG